MHKLTPLAMMLLLWGCSDDPETTAAGGGNTGNGGGSSACTTCDAPVESDTLFTFLQNGDYTSWEKESAVHASTGPHGSRVRVYLSPLLASSLADSNASHSAGSAVVKEFFSDDMGTLSGWAAWVKTEADSDGGNNIFWYENFSTASNNAVVDSFGPPGCTGCHSGGTDYLLIPYPLQ